jgi:hypothetical protein
MAKRSDLMGLGMSVFLAERLASEPLVVTAYGATAGAAYPLSGKSFVIAVTGSSGVGANAGLAVRLPNAGGDSGCLLGDEFVVYNLAGADGALTIYTSTSTYIATSATNIIGTTGVTIATYQGISFRMITATQWAGVKGAVA